VKKIEIRITLTIEPDAVSPIDDLRKMEATLARASGLAAAYTTAGRLQGDAVTHESTEIVLNEGAAVHPTRVSLAVTPASDDALVPTDEDRDADSEEIVF
jgi:hypothetical protein